MLVQLLRAATECEFDLVPDTDQVMAKGLDLGSRTATKGGTHDAVIMNLTPKCPCEGCVVHLHPAVLQHQLEIAVADREHQIPAHGPQDHLGRELPALERFALRHATRTAACLVETARLSNPDPPHKFAT